MTKHNNTSLALEYSVTVIIQELEELSKLLQTEGIEHTANDSEDSSDVILDVYVDSARSRIMILEEYLRYVDDKSLSNKVQILKDQWEEIYDYYCKSRGVYAAINNFSSCLTELVNELFYEVKGK